jgi:phosphorylcholine metabolism protein LicD
MDLARLFPDRRESGDTPLRQCQLVLLRMLKILRFLSEHHGFGFFLYGGTLLGAVRHKGFIPWDGDIDIFMLREDLEILRRIAPRVLPPDIFFQTPETDPAYPVTTIEAKLRDRYSNYYEWARAHPDIKHHNGLQIDIFVYDHFLSPQHARRHNRGLASASIQRARGLGRRLLGHPRRPLNPGMDVDYAFTRDELLPARLLPFEGTRMPVPNQVEGYLRFKFGDYMTLPPEAKRVCHEGAADPLHPCDHAEALHWEARTEE